MGAVAALFHEQSIVASVGIIGFVGLAALTLARVSGARTLRSRLWWVAGLGAALLCAVDQSIQAIGLLLPQLADLPARAVTGILGAPLLLGCYRRRGRARKPAGPRGTSVFASHIPYDG